MHRALAAAGKNIKSAAGGKLRVVRFAVIYCGLTINNARRAIDARSANNKK
jgi:hypothetical protein